MIYVLVAVLAAALGAGAVLALQSNPQPSGSASRGFSPQDIPSPSGNKGNGNTNTSGIDPQAVAAKVTPGVVDITASLRYTRQVFEGTGMVLSSSGLVLTNNHVVSGSTALTATVVSTGRRYTAKVVGTDAKDDVALLKLTKVSGLRTVKVGDSDRVSVGTQVVALGNAGGKGGQPTVTSGTITALHRTITAGDSGTRSSETLHNMLQTNALIAEGDSGGPLANTAGYVIGMNTAANTPSAGRPGTNQGFAIPINHALDIASQMAKGIGSSTIHIGQPPFMGIAVASTSSDTVSSALAPRQQLQQLNQAAQGQFGGSFGGGINSNGRCLTTNSGSPVPRHIAPSSTGTLIAGAFCNAPADAAGMTGGDVILAIDGQTVGAPASLTNILQNRYHPGDRISVTWMDTSGQRHTGPLTLIPGPVK
jgi:S1-C subfamily serine protease